MSELVKRPATWMARAVRDGDVGAVELLEAHAARIEERNGAINAIVLARLDAGARRGPGRRRGTRPRRAARPPARRAVHRQGGHRRRGPPGANGSRLLPATPRRRTPSWSAACGAPARSCSARRTCRSSARSGTPSTASTAPPPTRTTSPARRAARPAARPPPWRRPCPRSGSGRDLTGSIRAPAHWTGVFGLRTGRDAMPVPLHPGLPLAAGVQMFGTAGPMARSAADLGLLLACSPRGGCDPGSRCPASRSSRRTACSP